MGWGNGEMVNRTLVLRRRAMELQPSGFEVVLRVMGYFFRLLRRRGVRAALYRLRLAVIHPTDMRDYVRIAFLRVTRLRPRRIILPVMDMQCAHRVYPGRKLDEYLRRVAEFIPGCSAPVWNLGMVQKVFGSDRAVHVTRYHGRYLVLNGNHRVRAFQILDRPAMLEVIEFL